MPPRFDRTVKEADDDAPFDGALACAIAAMRRDGDARPIWTDVIACRDHSSPGASLRDFLRAPRAATRVARRGLGLAPPETAQTAAARAAFAYWARIGGGRPPAQRLCAPAIDRPLLVPWLFVIDAAHRPARFQLSGDAVDDFAGGPLAGAALAALAGDRAERALMDDALRLLRATDGPALARGEADYVDG
ncbi:MAG: hypothetical protein AAF684_07115, partial [Pseudomonadota bacterium]